MTDTARKSTIILRALLRRWSQEIVPGVFMHGLVQTKLKLPNGYLVTVRAQEPRQKKEATHGK